MMQAKVGDRLVIMSRHLDEAVQEGEIREVHGVDGQPPYVVHWHDGDREALIFPGPDSRIIPQEEIQRA